VDLVRQDGALMRLGVPRRGRVSRAFATRRKQGPLREGEAAAVRPPIVGRGRNVQFWDFPDSNIRKTRPELRAKIAETITEAGGPTWCDHPVQRQRSGAAGGAETSATTSSSPIAVAAAL